MAPSINNSTLSQLCRGTLRHSAADTSANANNNNNKNEYANKVKPITCHQIRNKALALSWPKAQSLDTHGQGKCHTGQHVNSLAGMSRSTIIVALMAYVLGSLIVSTGWAISVQPRDFNRLFYHCYTGQRYVAPIEYQSQQQPSQQLQQPFNSPYSDAQSGVQPQSIAQTQYQPGASSMGYQQPSQYDSSANVYGQQSLILGQQHPRAQTIDNFIALVSKIESTHPSLTRNLDWFIRALLNRFHYDNVYYDVRSRQFVDQTAADPRRVDIARQLLSPNEQLRTSSDQFPESALNEDEKCSMYFMMSHYIEKQALGYQQQPLASQPVQPVRTTQLLNQNQGLGLVPGMRPIQGTPNGGGSGNGPSPGYGTSAMGPAMNGPTTNQQPIMGNANPYGANTQFGSPQQQYRQQFGQQFRLNVPPTQANSLRPSTGNTNYNNNQQRALEFGVIALDPSNGGGAVAITRVLIGILAAYQAPQSIRQVATSVYPSGSNNMDNVLRNDDEQLDPLYAVTLAELWAISAEHTSEPAMLGADGTWNNTMCPTQFTLERADAIRVTNAELYGGLDGLVLGQAVRQIMAAQRALKLSDLLRMYYSQSGFRPQLPQVSVCHRVSNLNQHVEKLRQQAAVYFRLYLLRSVYLVTDMVRRLDEIRPMFEATLMRAPVPNQLCNADTSQSYDSYGSGARGNGGANDRCEVAKADMVVVMDTSPQANHAFIGQCVARLAPKLNMWRYGSTLSVLSNQLDTSGSYQAPPRQSTSGSAHTAGYNNAGGYPFAEIMANTTNVAEIGCSLLYDNDMVRYQGAPVQDPVKLMSMFEQTLVNLESNEFMRITSLNAYPKPVPNSYANGYNPSGYALIPSSAVYMGPARGASGPASVGAARNTGPAKVILWFNYMPMSVRSTLSLTPGAYSSQQQVQESSNTALSEVKRLLRENFRGASILAVGPNRADLAPFVYDIERDLFTQVPAGASSIDYMDQVIADNNGGTGAEADALAAQLLERICETPATFEYPQCYEQLSNNVAAAGYITPGRTQHWMMSPKVFFASRQVRLVFKVDGGRLRVCFGRQRRPDISARQSPSSSLSGNNMIAGQQQLSASASSSESLSSLGWNYGICKDVAPNQEIDFNIDEPCLRDTIGECRPFYFTISELSSQAGEVDPNWVCRDDACRRMDQVRFVLTHSGISCNSLLAPYSLPLAVYWILLAILIIFIVVVALLCYRRYRNRRNTKS